MRRFFITTKIAAWLLWTSGIILLPIGALVMPQDGSRMSLANYIPGLRGVEIWAIWGTGYAVMFAGMLLLRRSSLRTVLTAQLIGGLFCGALTIATPSTDPYAYFLYGHMETVGIDAWHPPRIDRHDDYHDDIHKVLHDPPIRSVYGPAFIGLETLLAQANPHASFASSVWIHRALMLVAACLVTALLRGPRIAYWALNPLVMMSFAVAGHNDALMLVFVAAAIRSRFSMVAGGAIGIAAMVKLPAAAALVFLRGRPLQLVAALGTAAVLFLVFPHAIFQQPFATQLAFRGNSPTAAIEKVLLDHHVHFASIISLAVVIAIVAFIVLRQGRKFSHRNGAGALTLALLTVSVYIQSWYFTWPLFCTPWLSRKLRILILATSALAWFLDFGVISPIQLHLPIVAFWTPILLIALTLYATPQRWQTSVDAYVRKCDL